MWVGPSQEVDQTPKAGHYHHAGREGAAQQPAALPADGAALHLSRVRPFLDRLGGRSVVPLREFARGDGDLTLRHDIDSRPDSAVELARLGHERRLRATYFVLHTARNWLGARSRICMSTRG